MGFRSCKPAESKINNWLKRRPAAEWRGILGQTYVKRFLEAPLETKAGELLTPKKRMGVKEENGPKEENGGKRRKCVQKKKLELNKRWGQKKRMCTKEENEGKRFWHSLTTGKRTNKHHPQNGKFWRCAQHTDKPPFPFYDPYRTNRQIDKPADTIHKM